MLPKTRKKFQEHEDQLKVQADMIMDIRSHLVMRIDELQRQLYAITEHLGLQFASNRILIPRQKKSKKRS